MFFLSIRANLVPHELDPVKEADEAADDANDVAEEAKEIAKRLAASLNTTKQQCKTADDKVILAKNALDCAQQYATTQGYQDKIATKPGLEQKVRAQQAIVITLKGKKGVAGERNQLAKLEADLTSVIELERSVYDCTEKYNTAVANQTRMKQLLEDVEEANASAPQRVVDGEKKAKEAIHNVLKLVYTEAKRKAEILSALKQSPALSYDETSSMDDLTKVKEAELACVAAEKDTAEMVKKWGNLGDMSSEQEDTLANSFKMCIVPKRYVLLERKFSIVGGSVRWMFGMNDNDALVDVNKWITRCKSYGELLSLSSGSSSIGASNHLLGCTKHGKKYYIQSRYIVLIVAERTTSQLVQLALNSPMCDNPAWQGWVFQLNFFAQLQNANKGGAGLVMITPVHSTDTWPTHLQRQRYYHDPTDLCGPQLTRPGVEQYENKLELKDYDWLIPTRWNQGCFDVLQILPNGLRVVQVTIAKTHSLKLRFILKLVQQLTGIWE